MKMWIFITPPGLPLSLESSFVLTRLPSFLQRFGIPDSNVFCGAQARGRRTRLLIEGWKIRDRRNSRRYLSIIFCSLVNVIHIYFWHF